MVKFKRGLMWLRRDLRLDDNAALAAGSKECEKLAVIYIIDKKLLKKAADPKSFKLQFILQSLEDIDKKLNRLGSSLIVRIGDPKTQLLKVANHIKAQAVYCNHDYDRYSKVLMHEITTALITSNKDFFSFKDHVIFEGQEILNGQLAAYKKFTPYRNKWLNELTPSQFRMYKTRVKSLEKIRISKLCHPWSMSELGIPKYSCPIKGGSSEATKTLKAFSSHIKNYGKSRDLPSLTNGTSRLSPHLRYGTISIRHALRSAQKNSSAGSKVWINELIWRDFYHMILDNYPHVHKHCFQERYDQIRWPGENTHFEKWRKGKTGVPIVDAGMRQLLSEGWMHNRLRMITAMFLCKDLLVDWRLGEKHFAQYLIDYDLASNNCGWQWSSGTGCDAQPYFRIFNPYSQSRRFDVNGDYIRKYIPELSALSSKDIHEPHNLSPETLKKAGIKLGSSYPRPIINHSEQRILAIELFKKVNERYKDRDTHI